LFEPSLEKLNKVPVCAVPPTIALPFIDGIIVAVVFPFKYITPTSLLPGAPDPEGPWGPVGPVAPVAPVLPVGPVGPVDPVDPLGPVAPTSVLVLSHPYPLYCHIIPLK
jgi:hypothetical protein